MGRLFIFIQRLLQKHVSRYQLKRLASCGSHVNLRAGVRITSPHNVSVGSYIDIAENSLLMGRGSITIGDKVVIGAQSLLLTVNHIIDDKREFYGRTTTNPISIGSHVWIGAGAKILPGVTIGDHAIVGAGAVVTKDVAPNTTVVGIPARSLDNK